MVLAVQLRSTALLEMLLLFIMTCGMALDITLVTINSANHRSASTQQTQVR